VNAIKSGLETALIQERNRESSFELLLMNEMIDRWIETSGKSGLV
jgi:hypothetical protein